MSVTRLRHALLPPLGLIAALLVPATANAGDATPLVLMVDDAGDDAPVAWDCRDAEPASGTGCTLREAIMAVNSHSGGTADARNTITFADEITEIRLVLHNQGGIDEQEGDLDITKSTFIDGPGVTVTALDLNPGHRAAPEFASLPSTQDRVVDIHHSVGAPMDVRLSGLTITGGFTQPGQHGGGIRAVGDCHNADELTLRLDDVTITGNMADPPSDTSSYTVGGGVYAENMQLHVADSTISGNIAQRGGGIGTSTCGIGAQPLLDVADSTISGNSTTLNVHGTAPGTTVRRIGGDGGDDGAFTRGAGIYTEMRSVLSGVLLTGNGVTDVPGIKGPDGTPFTGYVPWEGGGMAHTAFSGSDFAQAGDQFDLKVQGTWIDQNTAQRSGGGMHLHGTQAVVHDGNSFAPGLIDLTISNNVVTRAEPSMVAAPGGGGIATIDSGLFADNVTISGNSAFNGAGLLGVTTGQGREATLLQHTTMDRNVAPVTQGPLFAQTPPTAPSLVSTNLGLFNSVLQSTDGDGATCVTDVVHNFGGNSDDDGTCGLTTDRGDAPSTSQTLITLAANGGRSAGDAPTAVVPTHALAAGTEAIDGGASQMIDPFSPPPAAFAGVQTTVECGGNLANYANHTPADARGVARPQDGDNNGTSQCDRGAFEFVFTPPPEDPPPPDNTPPPPPPATVDVQLTKSGPDEVGLDDPVQFTITVTNAFGTAGNVSVTDTIPSGLTPVGASAPCTISGSTVTCPLGLMGPGQIRTVTIDTTASSEGTFTNTACASTVSQDTTPANNCADHTVTISTLGPAERVEGAERITTGVAASQVAFEDGGADAVVLVRADDFPDAQVATPLAVERGAPLLLSTPRELSASTATEITRVLPSGGTVYLVGGSVALENSVVQAVVDLGYTPVRLGGTNRFGTAALVAAELGDPGTVLLADGGDFTASVVAGAAAVVAGDSDFAQAGEVGAAVLLSDGATVPPETDAYLAGRATPAELVPIGTAAAAAFPDETDAIVGADPSEVSANVAATYFPSPSAIAVATVADFPDALVGGSIVGRPGIGPGPILLTDPAELPDSVADYVAAHTGSIARLFVLGGPAAIAPAVEEELNTILGVS